MQTETIYPTDNADRLNYSATNVRCPIDCKQHHYIVAPSFGGQRLMTTGTPDVWEIHAIPTSMTSQGWTFVGVHKHQSDGGMECICGNPSRA